MARLGYAWQNRPPDGTPLDPAHPLAGTIVGAYLARGSAPHRGPAGESWTVPTADASVTGLGGRTGEAIDLTNARTVASAEIRLPAAACTVAALVYPKGLGNIALFAARTSNSAEYLAGRIPHGDGNIYLNFGGSGSGQLSAAVPSGFYGAWHALVFRAGTLGSSIWVDGKAIASQSTAVSRSATSGLTLGAWPEIGYSDVLGVRVEALWVAAAEWSDAAIRDWSARPYGMYAAPSLRRLVVIAATGGAAPLSRRTLYRCAGSRGVA